jgi:hypothetical protein
MAAAMIRQQYGERGKKDAGMKIVAACIEFKRIVKGQKN